MRVFIPRTETVTGNAMAKLILYKTISKGIKQDKRRHEAKILMKEL